MRVVTPLLACLLLAACGGPSPSPSGSGSPTPSPSRSPPTSPAPSPSPSPSAPPSPSASPSPSPSPSHPGSPSPSPSPSASPRAESDAARRIEADLRFLADDLLEGREAGTRGYDLAALYVAAQYRILGLEPAGDAGSFFQDVPLLGGVRVQEGSRLELVRNGATRALVFEREFLPAIHYTAGTFELGAPLVFVGQAVHAPELEHDDFEGVDLTGKIAVFFGNAPERFSNDERAYYASSSVKFAELQRRGAVGYIGISDPRDEAKRPWEIGARNWRRAGMRLVEDRAPVDDFPALVARAYVRSAMADVLFEGAKHSGAEVVQQLKAGKLVAFDLPSSATVAGAAKLARVTSRNVVARRPGSDPALAGEHVVFTAHLDHVGIGAPVDGDAIHNGALDNALGVAVMLEAARMFAAAPAPKRSILFIALTAEEKGLLGAEHFARNPTVPKASLVANVNMDMPLLLAPHSDVVPIGVEHSSLQGVLERAAAEIGVTLSPDPLPEETVFIRSDQYPFVKQGIPAVYLDAGIVATDGSDPKATMVKFLKSHYHLPSDDPDLPIHYPGAARLAALNHRIGVIVADDAQRPRWNEGDFFGEKFGAAAR